MTSVKGVEEVHGFCDRRFSAVRDTFAANFQAGLETGASFAATLNGEPIIDLWAGSADAAGRRPWERDTIVNVFSTTKAMVAICANMLADRGLLDLEAPVASYWPEFAQAGKADLPVKYLLSHQAGLPGITNRPMADFYDWDAVAEALAAEAPWWEPGTANGYHAITFGNLVGEVLRRITGKSLGTFFRDEVAQPLGADFLIGFGPEEDARVGEMIPAAAEVGADLPPDSLLPKVLSNPPFDPAMANTREWRAAEIPAANGHGNARSCARIMSALACGGEVDGVRLLSTSAIERAIDEQCYRKDLVLSVPMRWGLGFMLRSDDLPISPNERTFGHGGAGGSLAIADMDARLSWAYVMNRMAATTVGDSRAGSIAAALYASL
ncbi:MAG: serine hydrolase domain-containing protein [Tepidiformaceae bacterium]